LSPASAAGWNRKRLAVAQTLLGPIEDVGPRQRLHSSGVNVVDPPLDLAFPFSAQIKAIKACGNCVNELGAITGPKLKSCLENRCGIAHESRV
jgi:hypothetical protein